VIESLEQTKKLIEHLKETHPLYRELLGFYEKVIEEQAAGQPVVPVQSAAPQNSMKSLQTREGFPLINRKDFICVLTLARLRA